MRVKRVNFTFHNVSIKSKNTLLRPAILNSLHSTMYLLNPENFYLFIQALPALHSTMYLLNPLQKTAMETQNSTLHSTMYLLNQAAGLNPALSITNFTFHNVSIKSCTA